MEVKNNLIMVRGEWGGDSEEGDLAGVGWGDGEKRHTTVIE